MTTLQNTEPSFEALLDFIRLSRGFDFTGYKRPSLMRRVDKRMQTLELRSYAEYRLRLEVEPEEFARLFDTILINVTGFFRDAPAWEFVRAEVVPRILESKDRQAPIRIWSTGCASGEEAYTLAMVFAEALGEEELRDRVKIYATDVDETALHEGRQASYLPKAVESVPSDLREKYFESVEGRYVFRPDLRRTVVFGRHDLIQDPPISRVDLLASRNTLMYFNPDAQALVLSNFHFALRDQGFLFLGKSEAMLTRTSLFTPVDLKRRVFVKAPRPNVRERVAMRVKQESDAEGPGRLASASVMREIGFETAAVAQLVVDRDGLLALANVQARALFGLSPRELGRPLYELEVSSKPVELRSRIEQVYGEGQAVTVRDVESRGPAGEARVLDVQLVPLRSDGEIVGVGITYADVTRYKLLHDAVDIARRDLETANEELQATVVELGTANEELQSANEELETTNEELQSTNEELETMNEELHSTNEELETMNDEVNQRTDELNLANQFLASIMRSLRAGVVVLDRDLRVTEWNDASFELWGLRSEEAIGRKLMELDIGLPVEHLRRPLQSALAGQAEETVLAATNRRGQAVECKIACSPLRGTSAEIAGAIVLIEQVAVR